MSKDTQIHSHSQIHVYLVSSSCSVFVYKFFCCFESKLQYQTVQKRLLTNVRVCVCVCVYVYVNGQEPDFFFEDLQMSLRISGSFDWTTWFPQGGKQKFFDFIQYGPVFLILVFSVMGFPGGSVSKESAMQETRVRCPVWRRSYFTPTLRIFPEYTSFLL